MSKETPEIEQYNSPEQRYNRFIASSVLRIGSSAIQAWGGVSGGSKALLVESAEELTDSAAFAGAAIEAKTKEHGLTLRARTATIGFAVAAACISTVGSISEIISEMDEFLDPLEGIDLSNPKHQAAITALAINSVVMWINRRGIESDKPSDRFAFMDSVRDFAIPGSIVVLAAVNAPHFGEFALEAGSAVYAWYNSINLWRGWRANRINNTH